MKPVNAILAVTAALTLGAFVTNCQSSDAKVQDAKEKVQDANQDLKQTQHEANADAQKANLEAQKAANADAWRIFRIESETKIKNNDNLIDELQAKMRTSGGKHDALYEERILVLKQKNRDLATRIDVYGRGQSDWESFKREFTHDMDGLGQAISDLTVNNKK